MVGAEDVDTRGTLLTFGEREEVKERGDTGELLISGSWVYMEWWACRDILWDGESGWGVPPSLEDGRVGAPDIWE